MGTEEYGPLLDKVLEPHLALEDIQNAKLGRIVHL